MPISLQSIAHNTADVTVQAGDNPEDTVTTVYYPASVTSQFITVFQAAEKMEAIAGFNEFYTALTGAIQSWDLFEDEAMTQMVPIDATRFTTIKLELLMEIYGAIIGDMRPNKVASQAKTSNS